MDGFQGLQVWQRGCSLYRSVFKALQECRDFGFRDQARRSALSVPSNVAEGYERGSTADYVRFLYIAKGSLAELRTQIHIGGDVGLIAEDTAFQLLDEAEQISRMLQAAINRLKQKP